MATVTGHCKPHSSDRGYDRRDDRGGYDREELLEQPHRSTDCSAFTTQRCMVICFLDTTVHPASLFDTTVRAALYSRHNSARFSTQQCTLLVTTVHAALHPRHNSARCSVFSTQQCMSIFSTQQCASLCISDTIMHVSI